MSDQKQRKREHIKDGLSFVKWMLYAGAIGLLVGAVGIVFHHGIDIAILVTGSRVLASV